MEVVFTETYVEADLIGGTDLKSHLKVCQDRAKEEKRPNVLKRYTRALKTVNNEKIRCLQIVDSGTTGLEGMNWDALVSQEGSVQKSGEAPGGNYGIGKNAVFNVSDLLTVFYSTRCVERGRIEKLQGKATLMAHLDPKNKEEQLQHIGFFAMPGVKPILGKDISDPFRLGDVGAGVFIMGFNPRSGEWAKEVTDAAIENFFYAIHNKRLVVRARAQQSEEIVVNHETLDLLFDGKDHNPSYHYYRAIRDEEPSRTDVIGKIGPLDVYVVIGSGPRRTAYLNRNGMLITHMRDQKVNPIAPRSKGLWPDYAAVVAPATDKGDKWIRGTENPSHDSMSPRKFFEERERRDAEQWFSQARDAIREIIDERAQVEKYGDRSNLDELASMLPDEFDPDALGNVALKTTIEDRQIVPPSPPVDEDDPGPDPGPNPGPGPGPNPGPDPGPNPGPGPGPGTRPAKAPMLKSPRFIPTSATTATIAFTITEDIAREVKLRLMPAGGEYAREEPVRVVEAVVVSPEGMKVKLEDGILKIAPRQNERIAISVTTNGNVDNLAVRIG